MIPATVPLVLVLVFSLGLLLVLETLCWELSLSFLRWILLLCSNTAHGNHFCQFHIWRHRFVESKFSGFNLFLHHLKVDKLTYLTFLLAFSAKRSFVKVEKLKQKKNNNLSKFTSLPTIVLVYIWQPSAALGTDFSFLPLEIILMFETCYVHLAWRWGEGCWKLWA